MPTTCKRAVLRWFFDAPDGDWEQDSGWVVGLDIGARELLWTPPIDRDYDLGMGIDKNQKRALVRRAAKQAGYKMKHGFKMEEDAVTVE